MAGCGTSTLRLLHRVFQRQVSLGDVSDLLVVDSSTVAMMMISVTVLMHMSRD